MTRYHNISGELTQELLAVGNNIRVNSISLCNIHANTKCTVDVYAEKKTLGKFYFLKAVELPMGVTLVYEDLVFDNSTDQFGLFIKLTKSASETPTVAVILM